MSTRSMWRERLAFAVCVLAGSAVVFGQATQMSGNSRLEVNLAYPELAKWTWEHGPYQYNLWYDNAHYDTEHAAMYRRCGSGLPWPDPGAPPVRTCMQQILHSYRMQGVTGVRIMFSMTDILDGTAWLTGFRNLLDDLVAAQIYYVTLTPDWGWANWTADMPNHYTVVQNPPVRPDKVCTDPDPPAVLYSTPAFMRFSPTSPYGERCIQDLVKYPDKPCTTDPTSGLEWRIDGRPDDRYLNASDSPQPQQDRAYRCSPPNTYNFLGWPTLLNALGTALQAVQDRYAAGLRLRELDLQNEIALESLPVRGRLIVDNTHSNYDVLTEARNLAQSRGLDSNVVTYSVFESRTGNAPAGGVAWDCASYWGDSARILGVSEITAAIGGGQFGDTNGNIGRDGGNGLSCGGDAILLENGLPIGHYQPKIVDLHFSPCRNADGAGGAIDCDPTQWDEVTLESSKGLSGLHSFQKSFYPTSFCQSYYPGDSGCGWRGYDSQLANSLLMLGETQGHGLVPELQTPGNTITSCAMGDGFPGYYWDVRAGRNTASGFNQSTLPNRNLPDGTPLWLIARPWEYPQQLLAPPDPYYCNAGRLDSMYVPSDGTVANQAPAAVSVTPSSGNTSSQTFGLVYTDANTYQDVGLAYVLVNSTLSFSSGCYIEYNHMTDQLRLRNDAGTNWLGPVSLAAGGLQNTQCALSPGATKSETGNTLTLNLPLRFLSTFAGAKTTYLLAQDVGGLSSNWQARGTWTVPGSCSYSISPTTGSFPASGGNGSVSGAAGAGCSWTATSNQAWVTITSGASGSGPGTVTYSVAANTANSRQGTLTIAGQTFTITQSVPTDLFVQNQAFNSGVTVYQATHSIVADTAVMVSGGASVTFASSNSVHLGPGFRATAGSAGTTFRAFIDPTIH